jgi:hypothetical protein
LTLKGKVIGIPPFGKVKFPNPRTLAIEAGDAGKEEKSAILRDFYHWL